jgi:hypothetical protein
MNLLKYIKSLTQRHDKQLADMQLSQNQINHVIAALCMVFFFIFIAGYYWGKKSALEHFTNQLESDSLADKVSYAFCSLYDAPEEAEEIDNPDSSEDTTPVTAPVSPIALDNKLPVPVQAVKQVVALAEKNEPSETHEYVAQLAGFGAAKTARTYAQMLQKKGYDVKIVERKSVTARGKQTSWYQVVTPAYTHKDQLLAYVDKIKKVSPIKDVKIVSVDISSKS